MAFVNTNRRTFRGRGGPSDGNIPNSLSRRNRVAQQESRQRSNRLALDRRVARTRTRSASNVEAEDGSSNDDELLSQAREDSEANHMMHDNNIDDVQEQIADGIIPAEEANTSNGNHISDELQKEISHLKRRVRNVQESIQFSRAIVNPTTWESNFLNAVSNCVNEWKSIVSFHHKNNIEDDGESNMYTTDVSSELLYIGREISPSVFSLVQMVLQSGPLTGSNPGYFKRCGGEVARVALRFLTLDVFAGDLSETLFFTKKQTEAVKTWIKNAEKAAESNKPPSKSMKKLQQGKGKSRAKKEKVTRRKG